MLVRAPCLCMHALRVLCELTVLLRVCRPCRFQVDMAQGGGEGWLAASLCQVVLGHVRPCLARVRQACDALQRGGNVHVPRQSSPTHVPLVGRGQAGRAHEGHQQGFQLEQGLHASACCQRLALVPCHAMPCHAMPCRLTPLVSRCACRPYLVRRTWSLFGATSCRATCTASSAQG